MPLTGILCRAALCIAAGGMLTFTLAGPAALLEDRRKPFEIDLHPDTTPGGKPEQPTR